MVNNDCIFYPCSRPVFLKKAHKLMDYISSLSLDDARYIWSASDKITIQSYNQFQNMKKLKDLCPAITCYDGIQYKYMAPGIFDNDALLYISKHLKIISGLYGILSPFDEISPYRLEMASKIDFDEWKSLYKYWGIDIYLELTKNTKTIVNLASKEYSDTITPHVTDDIKIISCRFFDFTKNNKLKEMSPYVKIARGEMVRFMAQNNIKKIEGIKQFNSLNYKFNESLSTADEYIFVREKKLC